MYRESEKKQIEMHSKFVANKNISKRIHSKVLKRALYFNVYIHALKCENICLLIWYVHHSTQKSPTKAVVVVGEWLCTAMYRVHSASECDMWKCITSNELQIDGVRISLAMLTNKPTELEKKNQTETEWRDCRFQMNGKRNSSDRYHVRCTMFEQFYNTWWK